MLLVGTKSDLRDIQDKPNDDKEMVPSSEVSPKIIKGLYLDAVFYDKFNSVFFNKGKNKISNLLPF